MSKSAEQLIMVLTKEREIYEQALKIAKEKSEVIIKGEVSELEKMTIKEQKMILDLGKLEKIREAVINNIATELKLTGSENITEIAEGFGGAIKEKLLATKDELAVVLKSFKKENNLNNKLIKQSLEYIEFNKNLFTSLWDQGSTYGIGADEKALKTNVNAFDRKV